MRLNILADSHWESNLDKVLNDLSNFEFRRHFEALNYGAGLHGVTVVFMCQDPALNLKRRIRHSKKESKLYMDIMLDLPTMKAASPEERKRLVAQRLFDEVPEVLSGYKIPDFDKEAFNAEFRAWVENIAWK
jgi:vacuolar-type H+-ATPase subunit F/Vma7